MRTAKVWSLVVILLVAGCGPSGSNLPPGVRFFLGDPTVQFYGNTLTFGTGGAPSDGRIQMLDPVLGDLAAQEAGEDLAFLLLFLLAMSQPDRIPLFELKYDWSPQTLYTVGGGEATRTAVKLGAAVQQNKDGTIVPAEITHIHVGRGQAILETSMDDPDWLGVIDLRTDVNMSLTADDFETLFIEILIEQNVNSEFDADAVAVVDGDEFPMGRLRALEDQKLEVRIPVSRASLDIPVRVRFLAQSDRFFKNVNVDFDVHFDDPEPPPPPEITEPRVQIAGGLGNEGLISFSTDKMLRLYSDTPAPTDSELPFMLVGKHGFEVSKSGPDAAAVVDSGPLLGDADDTTFRGVLAESRPTSESNGVGLQVAVESPVIAARILVGSFGLSIANYDNSTQAFEDDEIVDVGHMTDVSPFDGDPDSDQLVYVDNGADEIKFIKLDALDQFVIDPSATLTNAVWPDADASVVSAFRHTSGDLLFITDTPGALWVIPNGGTTATKVADVSDAPRTVRAAGNIAAVTSYGSGGLSFGAVALFVRSAAGVWGRAPFSRSGVRGVGIDVKLLPDGRVATASTSYLTHEVLIMVLDNTTGGILDSQLIPLPEGCTNPGHCVFVVEEGVNALLVSCNTSANIVVLPISFDE